MKNDRGPGREAVAPVAITVSVTSLVSTLPNGRRTCPEKGVPSIAL